MKIIGFTHEMSYPASDPNIYARLRLPDARAPLVIRALLDTGAAVTVLNRRHAKNLNIAKITGTSRTIELTTATQERQIGYIHPIKVEWLGRQMMIDAAFVPGADTIDMLGLQGFFDKMRIAFDHSARRVHVEFR